MAKVPFTKLKCKINEEVKQVKLNDEITIEVKQYLPIQEKLGLISRVVEYAHMEDANYSNPVKATVFMNIEIVKSYSNITFTDKQLSDTAKLYDMLYSTGIIDCVINNITDTEYQTIKQGVHDSIEAIYKYMNSIVGMLDTISKGQQNAELDIEQMQKNLQVLQQSPIMQEIASMISGA